MSQNQEASEDTDHGGLSEALAEDLDESAEEIEQKAEEFEIKPPWNTDSE